jgi:hypothetical protein
MEFTKMRSEGYAQARNLKYKNSIAMPNKSAPDPVAYPTNVVRRKDLVAMRMPHSYRELIKKAVDRPVGETRMRPSPAVSCDEPTESTIDERRGTRTKGIVSLAIAKAWQV